MQRPDADRLLEILYDGRHRGWLPGELARDAGMDVADLERALSDLQQRGNRLREEDGRVWLVWPGRLDAHLVERGLGTQRVGRGVICYDEVGSTNDVALASARQTNTDGLVVLAERQRAGRGRRGRTWISPAGSNVLMSVLLRDEGHRLGHEPVTIAAGLAVAEGIEDATGLDAGLKWPNDVLIDGAKVCGVLVEVRPQGDARAVVIGIGINVSAAPPTDEVNRPATSLAEAAGRPVERIHVVQGVLRRLDAWVLRIASGQAGQLGDRWQSRCAMLNERVTILSEDVRYTGRVLEVSPTDGLVMNCDDGRRVFIPAARASVEYPSEESGHGAW